MNQTPPKVVYLVIIILGILAVIGVTSLCFTMFYKNYADPAVLTAIISITATVCGSLGTVLVSTKTQPAGTTDSTVTTTITSAPNKTTEPQAVIVTNKPEDPVPTTVES